MATLSAVWTGRLTHTEVWVRARAFDLTALELRVADNADLSGAVIYPTPTPNAANVYSWEITGLQPDTRYHYRLDMNGAPQTDNAGSFRTHPGPVGAPLSYVFGAAGDAGLTGTGDDAFVQEGVSNNPVFAAMLAQSQAEGWGWFSHLGDLHYKNIATNDPALFRTAYSHVLNSGPFLNPAGRQNTFYRNIGITYTWDDHDFGANNSDRTSPSNPAANTAYREVVPHYGIPTTGIYQSWQVGRVLYIASDCRSFRDPNSAPLTPSKTMLGAAQKTWMANLLTANAGGAEALVWMTASRWLSDDVSYGDSWNSFPHERDELIEMLADLGWLDRMIQLTADKHALSICSGAANPHGGFPLYMLASMDSSYGSPDPMYDVGSLPGRQQYGTVAVRDSGRALALTGTGWVNGARWKSHTAHIHRASPVLNIPFGRLTPPFEPAADDKGTVNKVTVSREGGGEASVGLDEGRLSVQAPPAGVGVYPGSDTLNVATDEQLRDQAGWRVHLGTTAAPRIPAMHVDLVKNPELIDAVADITPGDLVRIPGVPSTPDPVDSIVEGGAVEFGPHVWKVELNGSPGPPWTVAQLPADPAAAGPSEPNRLDTSGSALIVPTGADDTVLYVHSPPAGVYDRAVWVPTTGPGPAFPDEVPFDVRVGGEVCRVTSVAPGTWDTFTRTAASGWGTSSSGDAWITVGGSAAERSVDGARGVVSWTTTPDTVRIQRLTSAFADCEVLVKLSADQVATGESIVPAVLLRFFDASAYYRARLHFGTSGGVFASVTRASTAIGSTVTLPYTYVAGTEFWLRARIIGQRVLLRVWPAVAAMEPAVWHIDRTIDVAPLVNTGYVGLTASAFAGNTNPTRTVRYDDFQVITPQRIAVQRAINGVVKPHGAGAAVSLAQPMIPPL